MILEHVRFRVGIAIISRIARFIQSLKKGGFSRCAFATGARHISAEADVAPEEARLLANVNGVEEPCLGPRLHPFATSGYNERVFCAKARHTLPQPGHRMRHQLQVPAPVAHVDRDDPAQIYASASCDIPQRHTKARALPGRRGPQGHTVRSWSPWRA